MEPIDVYLMYCAMKAHFSKNDYDFFTYKGKSRVPRNSFYKRKDRGCLLYTSDAAADTPCVDVGGGRII